VSSSHASSGVRSMPCGKAYPATWPCATSRSGSCASPASFRSLESALSAAEVFSRQELRFPETATPSSAASVRVVSLWHGQLYSELWQCCENEGSSSPISKQFVFSLARLFFVIVPEFFIFTEYTVPVHGVMVPHNYTILSERVNDRLVAR